MTKISVVLSSDFSPKFLNFLPLVSRSWEQSFNWPLQVGIVYKRPDWPQVERFVDKYGRFAELVPLEANPSIPMANQGKLARLFLAANSRDQFVLVDDMDTVHLDSEYLRSKIQPWLQANKMIAIGREVYSGTPQEGAFPMGNFSGPPMLFSELLGVVPGVSSFADWVGSIGMKRSISNRENPRNRPKHFSDEHLVRALRQQTTFDSNIIFLERNLNVKEAWLDRSWWPSEGEIRERVGQFESINFPRPLLAHLGRIRLALEIVAPNLLGCLEESPWVRSSGLLHRNIPMF